MRIFGVSLRSVLVSAGIAILASGATLFAAQTNYLGTVFIADPTTPTRQMTVNADGSINITTSSGGTPVVTGPPKLTAYGTLAVTTSSVALSTLTVGPNSPAWSTTYPSSYVSIRNSVASAGIVYFCPLGGTCSASVGEPIAQGETIFRNVASGTAITLFSTTGATVIAEE